MLQHAVAVPLPFVPLPFPCRSPPFVKGSILTCLKTTPFKHGPKSAHRAIGLRRVLALALPPALRRALALAMKACEAAVMVNRCGDQEFDQNSIDFGINLDLPWASLAPLTVLIVFLVPCLASCQVNAYVERNIRGFPCWGTYWCGPHCSCRSHGVPLAVPRYTVPVQFPAPDYYLNIADIGEHEISLT